MLENESDFPNNPSVESGAHVRIYENSTVQKPAVYFILNGAFSGPTGEMASILTLNSLEAPYSLKAFLQFSGGPLVLRSRYVTYVSHVKLLSASVTLARLSKI
jgi:hypothetical protein